MARLCLINLSNISANLVEELICDSFKTSNIDSDIVEARIPNNIRKYGLTFTLALELSFDSFPFVISNKFFVSMNSKKILLGIFSKILDKLLSNFSAKYHSVGNSFASHDGSFVFSLSDIINFIFSSIKILSIG